MRFDGRVLILGTAPGAVQRQLDGEESYVLNTFFNLNFKRLIM